jgi:hypothetical protein
VVNEKDEILVIEERFSITGLPHWKLPGGLNNSIIIPRKGAKTISLMAIGQMTTSLSLSTVNLLHQKTSQIIT